MKNQKSDYLASLFVALLLGATFLFSCQEGLENEPSPVAAPKALYSSPATHTITTGMTFSQMNSVLASTTSGDIVDVEPGTYTITGKLTMRDGITIRNQSSTLPVFEATSSSPSQLLEMYYSSNINNCSIRGIVFHNIRYRIYGQEHVEFDNCTFDYGIRKSGTDKKYLKDAYLEFVQGCIEPTVTNCTFSRRSGNSGRGIYNKISENAVFSSNTFGNGGSTGYFVTAINDNGNGSTISNNTISRNASWVNTAETDHGIYAHSFDGLDITGNTISGWPLNASGGAIKARNGENLTISNNTMNTSGVLLYVYNSSTHPFLNNVVVSNNTINVTGAGNNIYSGIGYWRNTTSGSEYSIRIEGNILPNGTIKAQFSNLVVADFNAAGGGVFNNDISAMYLKAGINNSGNY